MFFGKVSAAAAEEEEEEEDDEDELKSPSDYPDTPLSSKEDMMSEASEILEDEEKKKDWPLMTSPLHIRFANPSFSPGGRVVTDNELYGPPPHSSFFENEMKALGLPYIEKEEDDTLNEIKNTLGKKKKRTKGNSQVPSPRSKKQSASLPLEEKKPTVSTRERKKICFSSSSISFADPLNSSRVHYNSPIIPTDDLDSESNLSIGHIDSKETQSSLSSSGSTLSSNDSSPYEPATSFPFPLSAGPELFSRKPKSLPKKPSRTLPPHPSELLPFPPSSSTVSWKDAFKEEDDDLDLRGFMYSRNRREKEER